MNNLAIRVENISKKFLIGQIQREDTLRDAIVNTLQRIIHYPSQTTPSKNTIWALKEVTFDVQQGEVLGIIGRNGAGKSTLLKIISQITEPTSGRVIVNGRVGSLLEVGTGFHPELSGRENIYLNGAILGMKRKEIAQKFDEIVAFSEIERYIDTPVKRYSSGMYVRLAFAVAAHLETEILLMDEVLAVGDLTFQKKCIGKMGDIAQGGRTVLLVSHNIGSVVQLCPKALLLNSGSVEKFGDTRTVTQNYITSSQSSSMNVSLNPERRLNLPILLTRIWISDKMGRSVNTVTTDNEIFIGVEILCRSKLPDVEISLRFHNGLGQSLFTTNLSDSLEIRKALEPGKNAFLIKVPNNFLAPDTYRISVGIHRPNIMILEYEEFIISFDLQETGSAMWRYKGSNYGNILVNFPWEKI